MNSNQSNFSNSDLWLARFAKAVVGLTFFLILVGGHTTTAGAGMAFPDWPLSHGSINPHGWWDDVMMRLEHGHRGIAGVTGILVGILASWVWRSRWAVPVALLAAVGSGLVVRLLGASGVIVALTGIGFSALIFGLLLLSAARRDPNPRSATVRWLAFAAFLGVGAQAVLGGLRVILDPQGIAAATTATATVFRVLHGCFAQIELCLLVALAAMLSRVWSELPRLTEFRGVARLGWITVAFLFLQLLVGATMRHLGAGLAIPTWPVASPDGGWLPAVHNLFVDLNFTHTRVGAVVVTALILVLAGRAISGATGAVRLVRPAVLLLVLVTVQFGLGLIVIWQGRPAMMTTLHVVNGAALLATTVLLTLRAMRATVAERHQGRLVPVGRMMEVGA